MDQLGLERSEEALDDGVVIAIAAAAHAARQTMPGQERLVLVAGVLHSPIAVMQEWSSGLAVREGHLQSRTRQLRTQMIICRPTDDLPRAQVDDRGQIQPALIRRN